MWTADTLGRKQIRQSASLVRSFSTGGHRDIEFNGGADRSCDHMYDVLFRAKKYHPDSNGNALMLHAACNMDE